MFKFEKLNVWQKALAFADLIYVESRSFPADERFGLTNQIRRAANSISSNIAEGSARPDADFAKFLGYAAGSLYEVVTQIFIARRQQFLPETSFARIYADSEEILAQAGFERSPLDEPGLPSRHLVEDAGTYKFADPDFCRCVYTGGAKQYAELQRLRAERIAERNFALQHAYFGNANSPIVWGPWNPEGLDVIKAPVAAR